MGKRDFVKLYGLEGIREEVQEKLLSGFSESWDESLEKALSVESRLTNYNIRKKNKEDDIRFSTDFFSEHSEKVLVLEADTRYAWSLEHNPWSFIRRRRIVTALRYSFGYTETYTLDNFQVDYIQSVSGIKLKQYNNVKETLGLRPHELLFAHLIARIAPVLDKHFDRNVYLPIKEDSSFVLGERFCKKGRLYGMNAYQLNPNKERVKQIFGEGSPWLKSRLKS